MINVGHISYPFLVFLLLTSKQVNVSWVILWYFVNQEITLFEQKIFFPWGIFVFLMGALISKPTMSSWISLWQSVFFNNIFRTTNRTNTGPIHKENYCENFKRKFRHFYGKDFKFQTHFEKQNFNNTKYNDDFWKEI